MSPGSRPSWGPPFMVQVGLFVSSCALCTVLLVTRPPASPAVSLSVSSSTPTLPKVANGALGLRLLSQKGHVQVPLISSHRPPNPIPGTSSHTSSVLHGGSILTVGGLLVALIGIVARWTSALWPSNSTVPASIQCSQWTTMAATAEVDEDNGMVFNFGQVRWLPPIDLYAKPQEAKDGESVMPVFPLENAYLPGTEHVLNIFEPRYCEMYSTVILNGSRRFVVPLIQAVPSDTTSSRFGRKPGDVLLAEVGVIFYIDDFKKVDEETDGVIKYVCKHKVIGRARIKRLLNPGSLVDRKSYLRAVVEEMVDEDEGLDCKAKEMEVSALFRDVVTLHNKLKDAENVRFAIEMAPPGNLMTPGDSGTFWESANLWQALFRERLSALQFLRTAAEQELIKAWLKQKGVDLVDLLGKGEAAKVGIRLTDLPEQLQQRYLKLQEEFQEDAKPLMALLYWFSQLLVQEDRHYVRLQLLERVINRELQRLRAKAALQDILGGK